MLFSGQSMELLESEHRGAINRIVKSRSSGHLAAALEEARELKNSVWDRASEGVRAELLVLLGHCHLEFGDDHSAAARLIESASYGGETAKIQAQVALGHSLAGSTGACLTWAKRCLDKMPSNLLALQLVLLHDDRGVEEMIKEMEREVGARLELYSVAAQKCLAKRDYDLASEWFEKALSMGNVPPEVTATAAQLACDRYVHKEQAGQRIGEDDRAALRRALKRIETAICGLPTDEARSVRKGWFSTSIMLRRLLGEGPAVLQREVAALCEKYGSSPEFRRLAVVTAFETEDSEAIVALLEGADDLDTEDQAFLATAHARLGKLEQSVAEWRELLDSSDLSAVQRFDTARNLMVLLHELKQTEKRDQVPESFHEKWGETFEWTMLKLTLGELQGELNSVSEALDEAVALASRGGHVLGRLGDVLMRNQRFADAAEVYRRISAPSGNTPPGRRFVQALYLSGRYEEALSACEEATKEEGVSKYITEMSSVIHEELGNLEAAVSACEQYLQERKDSSVVLRLAQIRWRQGKLNEAAMQLEKVDEAELRSDTELLSLFSHLLVRCGRWMEGLEVMYDACRTFPNDAAVHLRYFNVFLQREGELPVPPKIEAECAVRLGGYGDLGWILIGDSAAAHPAQKEYSPSHSLHQKLIGRVVGEDVRLENGAHYTVEEIGSKHVFRFNQVAASFGSQFPGDQRIRQFSVPENPEEFVEQLRVQLSAREDRANEVAKLYQEGRCTLGAIAELENETIVRTLAWAATTSSGIVCNANTPEERELEAKNLVGSEVKLLDLTSILTLDYLGLLKELGGSGIRFATVQSVLDELTKEIGTWSTHSKKESMSIGLEQGQLTRRLFTHEEADARRAQLQSIIDHLRESFDIALVPPRSAEEAKKHGNPIEVIGRPSWDALWAASNPDCVLVSDDLTLRRLAHGVAQTRGASTASLLSFALQQKLVTDQVYAKSISRLVVARYGSLPINSAVLVAAGLQDNWKLGPVLSICLRGLEGPSAEANSAIRVGAEFIAAIWLEVILPQSRTMLLGALLNSLATGRRKAEMLRVLRQQLAPRLRLLPLAESDVMRVLDVWENTALIF